MVLKSISKIVNRQMLKAAMVTSMVSSFNTMHVYPKIDEVKAAVEEAANVFKIRQSELVKDSVSFTNKAKKADDSVVYAADYLRKLRAKLDAGRGAASKQKKTT